LKIEDENKEVIEVLNEAIKIKEMKDIAVISIMTDFTTAIEKVMDDAYRDLSQKDFKKILIEFHKEKHITSGGIAVLIGLLSKSQQKGQQICLTGLSEHFTKTFNMVGINHYTTIYPSPELALQEMSQSPKECIIKSSC
jgi:anti-anti-sigma factor